MSDKLEYSRLAFFATEAALLVGTILPIVAVTTPDWMRIHYQTRSFLGLMINVTVRLGLYQEETISGNVLQKDYAGWCGDGTATDPSQWCDKIKAIEGLVITSIVLGFLCLAMFTLSRGQPVRRVAQACSAGALLATLFVWIASGLWGQVQESYCTDFSSGYITRGCSFGSSFIENTSAGFFFLIAALTLLFGKDVTGGSSNSCLSRIV